MNFERREQMFDRLNARKERRAPSRTPQRHNARPEQAPRSPVLPSDIIRTERRPTPRPDVDAKYRQNAERNTKRTKKKERNAQPPRRFESPGENY